MWLAGSADDESVFIGEANNERKTLNSTEHDEYDDHLNWKAKQT